MCVATDNEETEDVAELGEASNVARHIKERVDDSLVLNHPIRESELALEVGIGVDRAQILILYLVNRDEVVSLRLVLIPEEEE